MKTSFQPRCPQSLRRVSEPRPGRMGPLGRCAAHRGGHPREDRGLSGAPGRVSEARTARCQAGIPGRAGAACVRASPPCLRHGLLVARGDAPRAPPAPAGSRARLAPRRPRVRARSGAPAAMSCSGRRRPQPTRRAAFGVTSPAPEVPSQPAAARVGGTGGPSPPGRAPGILGPGCAARAVLGAPRRQTCLSMAWGDRSRNGVGIASGRLILGS